MKDKETLEVDSRQPTFVSLSNEINVERNRTSNEINVAKNAKNISSPTSSILSKSIPKRLSVQKTSFENKVKNGNNDLQENGDSKTKESEKRKLGRKDVEKIIVKCLDVDNKEDAIVESKTERNGSLKSTREKVGIEIKNGFGENLKDFNDIQDSNEKEVTVQQPKASYIEHQKVIEIENGFKDDSTADSNDIENKIENEIENENFRFQESKEKFSESEPKPQNGNLTEKTFAENPEPSSQEMQNVEEVNLETKEDSKKLLEQTAIEKENCVSSYDEPIISEENNSEIFTNLPDFSQTPDQGKKNLTQFEYIKVSIQSYSNGFIFSRKGWAISWHFGAWLGRAFIVKKSSKLKSYCTVHSSEIIQQKMHSGRGR